ncbi:SMP-30/gluconolactonase/LRE family protein [Novosphingobium pentaromativorans]|uniref:SMP-30/Gluconolactonase/LRE-like region domain-containing protein n=1 Tax=Novosphingobium pentaromativorans US6-1 TaxID=1088721 RepID=G6ED81_9SPHN|nr:SMP-30/gluconolactonase/LRE family protein [Novosphingobium pentaromativorans]AIT79826.1 hypothetical protein JI59_08590 [Novosphingobium pentaromativorans US6-1]EHJ60745.1 hypothetical protein NSU_2303 [Novosphingobium pentaromativorans US6-1]
MKVENVLNADNYLGETPVWSPSEQTLLWVNCEQPAELIRWHPASGKVDRWPMPKRIGGFVLAGNGKALVVLSDGVYDFDLTSAELTLRAASPLDPIIPLHECVTDRQGRLWVGGFDHNFFTDRGSSQAIYFRLDGDKLTPVIEGITVANGLAFSPDGRTIYAGDSPRRRVDQWDLDPADGSVSNRRPFVTFADDDPGHIDGATVDAEGGYWIAAVGAAEVRRYTPDGKLDRTIELPFSNPTKPAFGGPDMKTLYITSTRMAINVDHPGYGANGPLYACSPGETGVADTLYSES